MSAYLHAYKYNIHAQLCALRHKSYIFVSNRKIYDLTNARLYHYAITTLYDAT